MTIQSTTYTTVRDGRTITITVPTGANHSDAWATMRGIK